MGWWSARIARWQSTGGAPPPKDHGWAVLSTVIAAIVTTGAIVYVVTMAPGVLNRLPLHYNWPPSLPTGFYRPSLPDALARGDLVRVCLPEAHAAPALERGYLNPGRCPGSTELLAKVLVALPGDTVHVGSTNTRESEGLVMRAPVVVLDSKSRPVPALLGPRVMGADECFVLST